MENKTIHFTLNNDSKPPVNVTQRIDSENDVTIAINGVDIAFLSSRDGKLHTYYVGSDDRAALSAVGIKFNNSMGNIVVEIVAE